MLFCLYMIVIVMLAGVGFFFGSYSYVGKFITSANTSENPDNVVPCDKFISEDALTCDINCNNGKLYLNKVCLTTPPYNPIFSTPLDKQITMYTIKECIVPIVYGSFISLVVTSLCFIFLICFAKLIYFYIAGTFLMLLGFAFYILKSVND